jgi:hypothetical protein
MNFLKMMRFYDSSLPNKYDQTCPKCGNVLVPSSYEQYYTDTPANTAMEYWCEYNKEIFSLWPSRYGSVPILKAFAADFIQDNQILLVNDRPTLFHPKLKKLATRCPICERDNMPSTGNMFYDITSKKKKWHVEYWCTYDKEIFTTWNWDSDKLSIEVAEEAITHGQFSPDL